MLSRQLTSRRDNGDQAAQEQVGTPGLARDLDSPAGTAHRTREAYAALAAGDLTVVRALLAADAMGYEYRNMQPFATYRGREAIVNRLTALMPSLWEAFSFELHDVVDHGALTLALVTWHGTSAFTRVSYLSRHVLLIRSNAAGQVTAIWTSWDDPVEAPEDPAADPLSGGSAGPS